MSESTAKCLICGMRTLSGAAAYVRHIEDHHALDGYAVRPRNTTGRTKGEIVRHVENGLKEFIVDLAERTHPASCRCVSCFDGQLDRMLAGQHITWGCVNG